MKHLVVFVVLVLFALGCSAPLQLPADNSAQKNVLLPFKASSINFVDQRKDTLTAEMHLPIFATRRREWTIYPGVNPDQKKEIIDMINNASNPDGIGANVTLFIEEGYYRIDGDALEVGEHARFDCSLRFDVLEVGNIEVSSSAFYDYVGVFNATEKHVKDVYRITLKNSVFRALKRSEKMFDELN